MPREQNLYQIYKLDAKFICDNNLDIKNFTVKQALQQNALVSVGDNIAFDQIRKLRGDHRTCKEIFDSVNMMRQNLRSAKKDGRSDDARIFSQFIYKTLFIKDIVSVESKVKSDYRRVAKSGFYLNGVRYVRFSASAGQIRHNTVLFVADDIAKPLNEILMCGIDKKVKEINIAKLSAYFSLSTSSVLWVTEPRVCIIKDFNTIIPRQKIDWICNTEDGKKYVEERDVDVELNSADGQGLVDPLMAKQWSEDMGLDYVASSYVIRSIWVKGNVVPFDFREYAIEHGINTITDIYGHEYDIYEIDLLLSESQFKMHKYYESWQEYLSYTKKNGIKWGVARYNKREDPEMSLTNYQYIQIMDINEDDIKQLLAPTVDWIHKICSGDELYALLYCFGGFDADQNVKYNDVYTRAQNLAMKAVVKNPDFLKDAYVQRKIYRNIVECINRAKLGKVWMHGNYQFMISDPIAQCRNALGLSPDGEIPADHIYSQFWNERNNGDVDKDVVLLRSPCLDKHEANVCKLYQSREANTWYKHIKSGIIYSIYDTSVCRHSDSDFDGDIVFSTDDPIFLKGSQKDTTNPIMYDKQPVASHKICHRNFVETDIRGFGTKVGTYSNYSTIIEAMLPLFQKPEQFRQRDELLTRKKLLREINGQEIDRIKGVEAKGPDKDTWLRYWQIDPDDDDATKAEKYYHNSLVISKKPYFFRYLYPELNKKYKQYESSYNDKSKALFGVKLKKLLGKQNKSEAEMTLIKRYHKFSPLINTNCIMNILCRTIEDIDFDIKWAKDNMSMLPYYDLNSYAFDTETLGKFRNMYQKWNNKKALAYIDAIYESEDEQDYKEIRFGAVDALRQEIQDEYCQLNMPALDALTYIKALSQSYAKFNWAFAWDLLGDTILDCIGDADALAPTELPDGKEYLGKYYALIAIPKERKTYIIDEETGEIYFEQ